MTGMFPPTAKSMSNQGIMAHKREVTPTNRSRGLPDLPLILPDLGKEVEVGG
jgi:hypothetical protein